MYYFVVVWHLDNGAMGDAIEEGGGLESQGETARILKICILKERDVAFQKFIELFRNI